MQLARMARSAWRPVVWSTDLEAFRTRCGQSLAGTFHCAAYPGETVVWDWATAEVVPASGVALSLPPRLEAELQLVREALSAAAPETKGLDGVFGRTPDGGGWLRIYDLVHPTLPLWRQVNLLADVFAGLESKIALVRPAAHTLTSSMPTEARYKRWLATWKKPGLQGVILKHAEYARDPSTAGGAALPAAAGGETSPDTAGGATSPDTAGNAFLPDACLVRF